MFKNIFTDKLNRLVYRNGEAPRGAAEAIKAAEAAKAGPAELREEAKDRADAIDDFLDSWEIRLGIGGEVGGAYKFDRNNPNNQDPRLPRANRDMYAELVRQRLAYKRLSRRSDVTRQDIDIVKANVALIMEPYERQRKKGDPVCDAVLERVPNARPKPKTKAERATARKEAKEKANLAKIARLVDKLMYMGDTPKDRVVKNKLRDQLKQLADAVMVGKNRYELKYGKLTMRRAKGPGTPAFEFAVATRRKLRMGGGPGAARYVKYQEKVYAGGSAKDFEVRA